MEVGLLTDWGGGEKQNKAKISLIFLVDGKQFLE